MGNWFPNTLENTKGNRTWARFVEGIRLDGRQTTDIRPIWCEVDYTFLHGSSVFTRGETRGISDGNARNFQKANIIDSPSNQGKTFIYTPASFCTGETTTTQYFKTWSWAW